MKIGEEQIQTAPADDKRLYSSSYSPYSKFPVGACVLTENNKTYCGCNFENSSFGLTICAERNAVGSAIADGERKIKAKDIILLGAGNG